MKRTLTGILALLYLVISSGVVLNVHYCMGKVSKVAVDNFNREICKCGSPEKSSDCCKDEFRLVKLEDAHKSSALTTGVSMPFVQLPAPLSLIDLSESSICANERPVANAPPFHFSRIYLFNCLFRI